MIIVAGGDSFVFGSELKDQFGIEPSKFTYPALLAKECNFEYRCIARPGSANNAISRLIISECEKIKENNIGVIVTWTFTHRYEFRFNYDTQQRYSPWYSINSWVTLDDHGEILDEYRTKNLSELEMQKSYFERAKKIGISDFAKTFYKHVGASEYYELYTSLREILFLQLYFEQNNIPYLFLPADNHFFDHPNYYRQRDEYIDSLYKQIKWNHWFFFESGTQANETKEPRGFYQWAIENKYPVGVTHPLEAAHADAAKLIKEKFNELVKKPLEQNSIRN